MKRHYQTVRFFDIKWDTDGDEMGDMGLPEQLTLEVDEDFDVEEAGADLLSDKIGFCVHGFQYEFILGNSFRIVQNGKGNGKGKISKEQEAAEEQLCIYAKVLHRLGVSKLQMIHQIELALAEAE
jgi:hypothetical protein